MGGVDPARGAAAQLLREVRESDAYANLAMSTILRARALTGRDAAFAVELAYGTLRWQGLYDAIINRCSARGIDSIAPGVLDALRLSTHQLLAMRVPDHAAVDAGVELARGAGAPGGAQSRAGFVNALLRRIAAHDLLGWASELGVTDDSIDSLAVRWSHPAWIVRAFADALDGSRDDLRALLEADNEPQSPALVARPGLITREELLAEGPLVPGRWSPLAAVLTAGRPESVSAVVDGRAGVQDEGSQLMALALARATASSGGRWLDLCAGPGGKTAVLAGEAAAIGSSVLAVELHPHRAELVRESVRGYPSAVVMTADGRSRPWGAERFDRVLVDAPCTGLGALRRRPEARWRKSPADLASLGPLQRELLIAGIASAAPGGVIAYVTCSPHLAETESVIADVVRRTGAIVEEAAPLLPEVPDAAAGPYVQLWPHRHGTDAMFLAILRPPN